jgi:hypothetical protein
MDYTGELAQPIYVSVEGLPPDLAKEEEDRAYTTLKEKFRRLFALYEIDPDVEGSWHMLCIALAMEHVPGMRMLWEPRPQTGWPRTWQAGLGDALLKDVEEKQTNSKLSIASAIRELRKDPNKPWRKYPQQTLETRHREARQRRERANRRRDEIAKIMA